MRDSLPVGVKAALSIFYHFALRQKNNALSGEIRHMSSRSTGINWLHKAKLTSDTFVCKDMSRNIIRCVSVTCPTRTQRKKPSFTKTQKYSKQICFILNQNMPTRSSHVGFDGPLLPSVISTFGFLRTLSLVANFSWSRCW